MVHVMCTLYSTCYVYIVQYMFCVRTCFVCVVQNMFVYILAMFIQYLAD